MGSQSTMSANVHDGIVSDVRSTVVNGESPGIRIEMEIVDQENEFVLDISVPKVGAGVKNDPPEEKIAQIDSIVTSSTKPDVKAVCEDVETFLTRFKKDIKSSGSAKRYVLKPCKRSAHQTAAQRLESEGYIVKPYTSSKGYYGYDVTSKSKDPGSVMFGLPFTPDDRSAMLNTIGGIFDTSEAVYEGDSMYREGDRENDGPLEHLRNMHSWRMSSTTSEVDFDRDALKTLTKKRKTCKLSKCEMQEYRKLREAELEFDLTNECCINKNMLNDFTNVSRLLKDGIAISLGINVSVEIKPNDDDPFIFGWTSPLEENDEGVVHESKRVKLE